MPTAPVWPGHTEAVFSLENPVHSSGCRIEIVVSLEIELIIQIETDSTWIVERVYGNKLTSCLSILRKRTGYELDDKHSDTIVLKINRCA